MIEGLALNWTDLGATGLVVLVVLMIFTGKLVPKRYYDEALTRCAEEREAKENYRKAAETLMEQNGELLTDRDLSLALLTSLKNYASAARDEPPTVGGDC